MDQYSAQDDRAIVAIQYYRGMREALDEEASRWLQFETMGAVAGQLRRERITQYARYRQLFEWEIAIARAQRDASLGERLAVLRYRATLRLAGLLLRGGIPGGSDLCDAAASGLVRITYPPRRA
ncbi:MAG TPA: hypothetical protein VGL97_03780 [Bryobacteraceae bacterium]